MHTAKPTNRVSLVAKKATLGFIKNNTKKKKKKKRRRRKKKNKESARARPHARTHAHTPETHTHTHKTITKTLDNCRHQKREMQHASTLVAIHQWQG